VEWCKPQQYNDFMGAIVARQPNLLHAIAFVRLDHQPLFDTTDLARLQFLIPHITRAVTVADRLLTLENERRDVLAAIDQLPVAMLIIDHKRHIRQANTAASALLAQGDHISVVNGVATLADQEAGRLFREAFEHDPIKPLTLTLSGDQIQQLTLMPHDSGQLDEDSQRAFVFLHAQATSLPAGGAALKAHFGFTTAELRILMMLMEGNTRNQIALDLGLSIATVKTHLQALFRKTGTSRQADLVRAVMSAVGAPSPS
jgi:DNA-binding CsgD family transcriptional regulator